MSAKKATEEKKSAPATAVATEKEKADEAIANQIINELDRVHVRTPRY